MFEFIEAQGNSWGARPEVIRKAASALSEFGEVVTSLNLATGKIKAQTSFDEFNLDITVYYDGSPMSFPNCVPSKEELLTDETAYTRLAGYLISKYVDKIRSESEDGKCTLYFHFNH
ncbi:MAG TPA: hypothetical protein DDW50_11965 [Firmicutes bacterium]|nr:hypothetical protein [Bacillota bacterium]